MEIAQDKSRVFSISDFQTYNNPLVGYQDMMFLTHACRSICLILRQSNLNSPGFHAAPLDPQILKNALNIASSDAFGVVSDSVLGVEKCEIRDNAVVYTLDLMQKIYENGVFNSVLIWLIVVFAIFHDYRK